jgi:DNA-binding beta-propeller fold protein YncE
VDSRNCRIQRFTSSGAFLAAWAVPGSVDGWQGPPTGVEVDSVGNVYVADRGGSRILVFGTRGDITPMLLLLQ